MDRADTFAEYRISYRPLRGPSVVPAVEAAVRHTEHSAHGSHGEAGLVRAHEFEDGVDVFSLFKVSVKPGQIQDQFNTDAGFVDLRPETKNWCR